MNLETKKILFDKFFKECVQLRVGKLAIIKLNIGEMWIWIEQNYDECNDIDSLANSDTTENNTKQA